MKEYLQAIQHGKTFTRSEAGAVMTAILQPGASATQIAALLFGLSVRGETTEEIIGFVEALRQRMIPLDVTGDILDTCGTGGDGQKTFNISTITALVCAAMGVPVVKHGNVAISSKSGSADCLAALHIPTQLTGTAATEYFTAHNFVFAFAPLYHPALKALAPIRKDLQVRTVMNFLGPMLNPARPAYQLVGVSDPAKAQLVGEVLMANGAKHVAVVHSADGLDEVSIAASTTVLDFTPSGMKQFYIEPERNTAGLAFSLGDIQVESPQASAACIEVLAAGKGGAAAQSAVALNAGLALYVANRVDNYAAGVAAVRTFLADGKLFSYLHTL